MANIRNHCSWVHSDDWDVATSKAKDLVRMAVARASLLEPQHTVDVPVQQSALVVGGGVAGMTAALSLSEQGYPVDLVEKAPELGGNLRSVYMSSNGKDPQDVLAHLVEQVQANQNIAIHMESRITSTGGFMGNFTSVIQHKDGYQTEIKHGATILATGSAEYKGPEYGYGSDPRIVTQQEFEALLAGVGAVREPPLHEPPLLPDTVVMIQCVGPAEQFCSRICCTVALKNALALKERNPKAQIIVLYKDIRTYGFKERLYSKARELGVLFVRYDDENRPQVGRGGSRTALTPTTPAN
jgi:heterodisulfide reductase subunit A